MTDLLEQTKKSLDALFQVSGSSFDNRIRILHVQATLALADEMRRLAKALESTLVPAEGMVRK